MPRTRDTRASQPLPATTRAGRAPRTPGRLARCVLLLLVAGCAAEIRPPYLPFALPIAMDAAPGTPLTGPVAEPLPSDDPDAALHLTVTVEALSDASLGWIPAVDSATVLVAVRPSGLPIQGAPSAERGLRLLRGTEVDVLRADIAAGAYGRHDVLAREVVALPDGATASLRLGTPDEPTRSVEVAVFREPEPRVAILLRRAPLLRQLLSEDDAEGPGRAAPPPRQPPPAEWPLEISVLEGDVLTLADRGGRPARCALLVPAAQAGWPDAAVMVELEVRPAPSERHPDRAAHEDAMARGIALWTAAATAVTTRSRAPATGLSGALSSLRSPARRGPALVYLASATGARLAEDMAFGSDPTLLSDLARAVLEVPVDDAQLGFHMERAALRVLAARAETTILPPEHAALLTRRTGQLARDPAVLSELVAQAESLAELEQFLVDENLAFLEDAEPSARVRAYDWLDARDLAPTGFDPLASREARRAALEAHLDAALDATEVAP